MYALQLMPPYTEQSEINTPVTAVISRLVVPGKEADYEEWASGITQACSRFEGYLGTDFIRPVDHHHPEYVTIFRFDSYEHLRNWHLSETAQTWIERLSPLIRHQSDLQLYTGLDYWFTLNRSKTQSPAVWKMSLLTWIGLVPMVWVIPPMLAPYFTWMPNLVFSAMTTGITVWLISYAVLPLFTQVIFRRWLFPNAPR